MSETLKIVIPMAGLGSRLRPHTWSRPKALLNLAGKTVLDYVLDLFKTLPEPENVELILIVGYLGDQIKQYMDIHYPQVHTHYVWQNEMRGQSHAIYLGKEYLHGPMIMAFADTLIETSFAFLKHETCDGVAWVKPVPDPRRFGVAVVNDQNRVTQLIEKPSSMENNLAVVGFYYFNDSEALISAIGEQIERGITLKNEFFLADAINILLERGITMRTEVVNTWLDAGTHEAMLETNAYLLDHGRDNSHELKPSPGISIIPPVYIHPEANIEGSVIGPYATISAGCNIQNSIVRNSILEDNAFVKDANIAESMLGREAQVIGQPVRANLGDQSWATK